MQGKASQAPRLGTAIDKIAAQSRPEWVGQHSITVSANERNNIDIHRRTVKKRRGEREEKERERDVDAWDSACREAGLLRI